MEMNAAYFFVTELKVAKPYKTSCTGNAGKANGNKYIMYIICQRIEAKI